MTRRVIRYESERKIEKKIADDARDQLCVLSLKLELRHNAGWPDRLFLIPGGRPLFLEIKRSGEAARKLQEYRHLILRTLRYDVEVCDNYDDAMAIIKRRING